MTLISSVMATKDRPMFAAHAINLWRAQTHPDRELVIVDDSDVALGVDLNSPDIRFIRSEPRTLGEKLNIGIEASRGGVIHKWDDDDWYSPAFLSRALAGLDDQGSQSGFVLWGSYLFYLLWSGTVHATGPGHKAGMSLTFRRELWEEAPFRDIPHSVDSWWINDHAEYAAIEDSAEMLVAIRHKQNTWQQFWDVDVDGYIESEWPEHANSLEDIMGPGAAFYRDLTAAWPDVER